MSFRNFPVSPAVRTRGFSLLEALVSIAIFLAGAVAIVFLFPQTLQASHDAELKTKAAFLAQMKAEEIRRDDDQAQTLAQAIAGLPEPTTPLIPFAQEPELCYAFSGRSLLWPEEDASVPDSQAGVARVIVFRNRGGQPPANPQAKDVVYELRFAP